MAAPVRVPVVATPHAGIKTMPSFFQCRRCGADNVILDEVKKRGQDIFHGFAGSLPLECRACGEIYIVSGYTIP